MDKDTVIRLQEHATAIAGKFDSSFDAHVENRNLVKELEGLLSDIAKLHKSIVPLFKDIKSKTEDQRTKMREVLTAGESSGKALSSAKIVGSGKGKESTTDTVDERPKAAALVTIAPGFTLPQVISVDNWRKVPPTYLYYNTRTEEFGVRICGLMMSGKIGELYGQSVRKYLDCRAHGPGDDISKCNFYHDPARFSQSKDRRGFPNRARYESPSGVRPVNPYNLVAGSLSNLSHDLKFIKPREAVKIKHYAMHWLLVAMLAEQSTRS